MNPGGLGEDINANLLAIFDQFDRYCRENTCLYNIVCDEPEIQGYVIHDKKRAKGVYDYLQPVLRDKKVHLNTDENRSDGVLFTFTLQSIQDGYWKPLPPYPKREDFSPFAKPEDAKKVRAGKTIYQKSFKKQLESSLGRLKEDQYKQPTGKHRRQQSAFRSSFSKSKSLGGCCKEDAVAGSSIPPQLDSSGNIGVPVPHMQSILSRLDERLTSIDGADPYGTMPGAEPQGTQPEGAVNPVTPVNPDDTVSKQARDPSGMQNPDMIQQAVTMLPGTSPQVNGSDSDPGNSAARKNVASSGTRDPNGPQITTTQVPQTLPNNEMLECITRPEDGYDLIQQLVSELGMVSEVRKVTLPDRTFVKACDGELRLEYDEPGKLTVYRHSKKITELPLDLSKNTVVDEIADKVLRLMER